MADYKYCPLCAHQLEDVREEDKIRRKCPSCGFTYYKNPVPAAGCVIFERGRLLWVQRAHPPRIGDWTLPAGFCEWEENPARTAVRELKEETNLDVKITGLFRVYNGNDDPRTNAILIMYFAEVLGGELRAADDAMQARFFGLEESPQNIAFQSHRQALSDLKTYYPEKFKSDAD